MTKTARLAAAVFLVVSVGGGLLMLAVDRADLADFNFKPSESTPAATQHAALLSALGDRLTALQSQFETVEYSVAESHLGTQSAAAADAQAALAAARQNIDGLTALVHAASEREGRAAAAAASEHLSSPPGSRASPDCSSAQALVEQRSEYAYVTLHMQLDHVSAEERKRGLANVLTLLHGLLVEHRTAYDVVVLVTPEISPTERALFTQAGAIVTEVEKFTVPNPAWPAYNDVATKLHVWTLSQYSRIVYLDSDIVVCSQPDRILDACPVGSSFCAVLDQGQNGEREGFCNTGVFVVQPNMSVFQELNANKSAMADLRYADQDWLNQIYSNYTHLDDRFNEASALRFDNKMRQCRVGSTVFMHGKFWQLLQEFPGWEEDSGLDFPWKRAFREVKVPISLGNFLESEAVKELG